MKPNDLDRAILRKCKKDATAYFSLPRQDVLTTEALKTIFKQAMEGFGGEQLDKFFVSSRFVSNSNLLQTAVTSGDVRLMEACVAQGTALDYRFFKESQCQVETLKANGWPYAETIPPDNTALSVGCAMLAAWGSGNIDVLNRAMKHGHSPIVPDSVRKQSKCVLECCIQLVRLGANMHNKFNLHPGPRENEFSPVLVWHALKLHGKTCKELAHMS